MNIPNFPTDNLYKFVAVFGLVATLAGLIAPTVAFWNWKAQKEIDAAEGTREVMKRIEVAGGIENLSEYKNELDRPKSKRELIQDMAGTVGAGERVLSQLHADMRDSPQERALKQRLDDTERLSRFFFRGGIALSVAGFVLWWCCVQRYQDRLIRAEAENAEAELAALRNQPK